MKTWKFEYRSHVAELKAMARQSNRCLTAASPKPEDHLYWSIAAEIEAKDERISTLLAEGSDLREISEAAYHLLGVYRPPDFAPGAFLRAWRKLDELVSARNAPASTRQEQDEDPDPVCDRCGEPCCGCYAEETADHDAAQSEQCPKYEPNPDWMEDGNACANCGCGPHD